ncbi:hypothetical protein [Brevundimonas goettingensis]|uniref:Uncharacterized protein n=1 Tax=Brevundimonas goettingensis TaxID=2774190 RepID=A0A975C426_9CAUL|nr:hypothetical protein [Brevundimonas goettingensis]QTC91485.1 hypothetical protein IFJ75_00675 [Brevundimonas goettingensis]
MKASTTYRLKLASVGTLAGGSLISALALAIALAAPQIHVPVFDAFGVGAEARADAALESVDPAEALRANRASLNAAPMAAAGWLRIAWLQTRDGSPLNAEGLDALEKSYTVAPFGPDVTVWRLNFLYEHWNELTPKLREEASHETVMGLGWRLDASKISNPSGRLAASLNQVQQTRRYQEAQARARDAAAASGR